MRGTQEQLRENHSSHPYEDPVPPAPVIFPPPPKAPPSPSRPPAAGAASLAKKATVFPTVLIETAPSIGAATAGAWLPGDSAAAAVAAVVVASAGDGTRILFSGFNLVPPPLGFDVLALGSTAGPAPPASPTVMALMILMCRFVHGRFSWDKARITIGQQRRRWIRR